MKPDRHTGIKINEMGCDAVTGEFVLVINCRCTLPHETAAAFGATHDDGCLMKPCEGLVFQMDGTRVAGWDCRDVFARDLQPVPADTASDIRQQMTARLEADRRKHKAANFRGGGRRRTRRW